MRPLYTLTHIVGNEYTEALDSYMTKSIKSGEYVDSQSVEGAIHYTLKLLAQGWLRSGELIHDGIVYDLIHDELTDRYSFGEEIMHFNEIITKELKIDGNIITINSAYLTCLVNQTHDFGKISLRSVNSAVLRIFTEDEYKRSTVTFKNMEIPEYFDDKKSLSCYKIRLDVGKYGFDKIKQKMHDDEEKDLRTAIERTKNSPDIEMVF